jgi:soluble lytic murein transglycosylase
MKRYIVSFLLIVAAGLVSLYFFNQYWIHRFDPLIARHAAVYHLDPDLVWSVIYEETYFSPWKIGEADEVGLMQVTPTVGREWAEETGMRELAREMESDPRRMLADPERNIQIGCWYLEKVSRNFRDAPAARARMLAAYNAGPSRAAEWSRTSSASPPLTEEEFISRIDFPTTRAYVTSILARYRQMKEQSER